jgi:hypothetical protein
MRWKYLVSGLLGAPLLALLFAIALFGARPELALQAAQRLTATSTDYRLELEGAQLSWHPFRFSADLLLLRTSQETRPPLFSAQHFAFEGQLLQLLRGGGEQSRLSADNLTLYLESDAAAQRPDAAALLRPLGLLPAKVEIDSVHLVSAGDNLWIFPIHGLFGAREADGRLVVSGAANTGASMLRLRAALTPTAGNGLLLDARVRNADDDELELVGPVTPEGKDVHYELSIQGHYQRINDFLRAFDERAAPLDGGLTLQGRLSGGLDHFDLSVTRLDLEQPGSHRLSAVGTLSKTGSDSPQLALEASMQVDRSALPGASAEQWEDAADSADLTLSLRGTLEAPRVEEARVVIRGPGELELTFNASALTASIDNFRGALEGATIRFAGKAENSAAIEALVGGTDTEKPLTGPWTLRAALRQEGDYWVVSEVDGSIAAPGDTRIAVSGLVARARIDNEQPSLEGLQLSLSGSSADPQALLGNGRALPKPIPPVMDLSLELAGDLMDLRQMRGIALRVDAVASSPARQSSEATSRPPLPHSFTAAFQLSRAAEPWLFSDLDASVRLDSELVLSATGNGEINAGVLSSADLALALDTGVRGVIGLPGFPGLRGDGVQAQLRVRERYATLLGELRTPHAPLQMVATADLDAGAISALRSDIYTPRLDVEDLVPADGTASRKTPTSWLDSLPRLPLLATLRIDELRGSATQIDNFVLHLEGEDRRYLLRQLDARYQAGDLQLRGVVDLSQSVPQLSLAGQGIGIPLGALASDMGMAPSLRSDLSFRGGVSAGGWSTGEWLASMNGRLALALADTTVSGAAYDLLMTNILAWVAVGAGEETTTFDCGMAQFDISEGLAQTDSLYLETPRMVATGKGRIDLKAQRLDIRLEPRSRSRTVQFPSAVKVTGPLTDPEVSASGLQATADASAQALLLIPSLTLRLFGIGPQDQNVVTPCVPNLR